MLSRMILAALVFAPLVWAQDTIPDTKAVEAKKPEAKPEAKQASTDGAQGDKESKVVKVSNKEKIRILTPKDLPAEIKRLKSKADIKASITVRTSNGRTATFDGVIRNGKLVERIIKRRFVPQKDVAHPRCGVRIWWSGGSDGYIFFRYSVIKTLAIIGKLSDAERREIMRKLQAKRDGTGEVKGDVAGQLARAITKMGPEELKRYMIGKYPYGKGWDHKRMRALKRRKLIENKVLSHEEEIFVKYFSILVEAHFEALKRSTKKVEIEPGTEGKPESSKTDDDKKSADGKDSGKREETGAG